MTGMHCSTIITSNLLQQSLNICIDYYSPDVVMILVAVVYDTHMQNLWNEK